MKCYIVLLRVQKGWFSWKKPHHSTSKAEKKASQKIALLDWSSSYRTKYTDFFTTEKTTNIKFIGTNPPGEWNK